MPAMDIIAAEIGSSFRVSAVPTRTMAEYWKRLDGSELDGSEHFEIAKMSLELLGLLLELLLELLLLLLLYAFIT